MQGIVLDELHLSTSVVLSGEELVPRFRVICPTETWTVFVPLPDDIGERQRRMQLLYAFMAWKAATAFVMSSELKAPEALISAAVGKDSVLCAYRPLTRTHNSVGPVEWLSGDAVGDEVVALLPRGRVELGDQAVAMLMRAFGGGGEFDARLN